MSGSEVIAGRYELGARAGVGGSAEVFIARDRYLDRPVAVKILDEARALSADPAGHARFVREGRSSARFSHPNAVATFDAGRDDGRLFLVMEYVAGGSLAERLARSGPLGDADVLRLGTELLGALGAAHAAGLVHRDVKPANVLFDESGSAKLADFGIAQRFDEITSSLTVEGMAVGTRGYIAPEQARGEPAGPRTDIYGVGAVLFEAATGERPPPTPATEARGADPRVVRPSLDPALAEAISVAMAGSPEHRFASSDAMSLALRTPVQSTAAMPAVLEPTATMPAAGPAPHRPIPAPAPLVAERAGSRRRNAVVLAAVALLVGGIIAVAATAGTSETPADDAAPVTVGDTSAAATPSSTAPPATTTEPAPETTATPTSTSPPTTSTVPVVEEPELVPGVPATDDPDEFIAFLRDSDGSVAGRDVKKLGNKMRDIRREDDPDKRIDKVEKLIDDIDEWIGDDTIDSAVALRALDFLDDELFLRLADD